MSILTELKKLTKKKNATVVSQALPDSLDGSGSGGGVNVLTLYGTHIGEGNAKAYKNLECTEEYESYIEAFDAVRNADIIKIVDARAGTGQYHIYMALDKFAVTDGVVSVAINVTSSGANKMVDLWISSEEY